MEKISLKTTIIISLFFIIWLILEIFLEEELTISSANMIKKIQELESETLDTSLNYINNIIPLLPIGILILTMQSRSSKIDVFYSFTQILVTMVLNSTLKVLFRSSRPYLEFDKIKAIFCECSYGNPSFHTTFTTIAYFVFLNDLRNIYKGLNWRTPSKLQLRIYYFIFGILVLVESFVRMYSGVHYYGECVCGLLLALTVFFTLEFYRRPVRKYLYRKYDMVRSNFFAQIWSMILPIFFYILFFLFNSWVINRKPRDLTLVEKRNIEKCPNCKTGGLEKTSTVGLIAAYYIPGMILCFSIMSFNKTTKKKHMFTTTKKILRFIFNTFFRILTITPLFLVYKWRFDINEFSIHLILSILALITPSIGFGFPGILYKKCELEICTDFIRKDEDPNEDEKRVLVSDYLLQNERTVEWDVNKLNDYGDNLISQNESVDDVFHSGGRYV